MRIHQAMIEQQNLQMLRMPSNPNVPSPQARPRILQDSFTRQLSDSEAEEIDAIEKENAPSGNDRRKSPKRKPAQFAYEQTASAVVESADELPVPGETATTGRLIHVIG